MALQPWVRPIAYCESDRYCQSELLCRMRKRDIGLAPIWDDVRTLRRENIWRTPDIIYGGFPCQDLSVAGNGAGLGGERSGLYWELHRLVKEIKPTFVFLENVPSIRTRGLNEVVRSLTEIGYDCRWTIVSAAEIGAVHIRKRWFLLAYSDSVRLRKEQWSEQSPGQGPLEPNRTSAPEPNRTSAPRGFAGTSAGFTKPRVDRAGDGIPLRVDRHRALGNAVVPAQAKEAFERLIGG